MRLRGIYYSGVGCLLLEQGDAGVREEALGRRQVVEGVRVAPEVLRLAQRYNVDMPITHQVVEVLAGRTTPLDALRTLATRPPRHESE